MILHFAMRRLSEDVQMDLAILIQDFTRQLYGGWKRERDRLMRTRFRMPRFEFKAPWF